MSDTQHTALPWFDDGGLTIYSQGARQGRTCPKIARMEVGADHDANMNFIIRASNSHHDLLAACEAAERSCLIRESLSTNYARLASNGHTETAESKMVARDNITALKTELSKIRLQIRSAIENVGVR